MEIWVALSLPLAGQSHLCSVPQLMGCWGKKLWSNLLFSPARIFLTKLYVREVMSDSICSKSGDALELSSQQFKAQVKVTDRRNYLGIIWEQDAPSKCPPMAMGDGMRWSLFLPTQTAGIPPWTSKRFGLVLVLMPCMWNVRFCAYSSKHNDCMSSNLSTKY